MSVSRFGVCSAHEGVHQKKEGCIGFEATGRGKRPQIGVRGNPHKSQEEKEQEARQAIIKEARSRQKKTDK